MSHPWPELDWWKSKDYDTVRQRLEEENNERLVVKYCDVWDGCFNSLSSVAMGDVRVIVVGQDPYPDRRFRTGIAFSVPDGTEQHDFPRTLRTILKEYSDDLSLPLPSHGSLRRWTEQGVLLLNAIPSIGKSGSLSHDWSEYHSLTKEIVERLQAKGRVFAFLGSVARRFEEYVTDDVNNRVICTSHPSPRGNINSKTPFSGSRLFSTINSHLNSIGLEPIDWSLDVPAASSLGSKAIQGPSLVRTGAVLPNESGVSIPWVRSKK